MEQSVTHDIQALLRQVEEELKLLKQEGEESIYVSEESMQFLEEEGEDAPGPLAAALRPDQLEKPRETPRRSAGKKPERKLPPPPEVVLPEGSRQQRWEALRDQVLRCKTCNQQVKAGNKVVFGVGSLEADIFFCGEAPGAEEEVAGEPFVGPAGQLLTKIIQAMGLSRGQVYIGNIMNWRPDNGRDYGNRPPTDEEMAFCLPYLMAQIEIVQPKVLVALGATAVRGLLGLDHNPRMGDLRGRWQDYQGIPLMVTYHPSYLLRNQSIKRKREVWEDMLLVMDKAGLPISEKQRSYFSGS